MSRFALSAFLVSVALLTQVAMGWAAAPMTLNNGAPVGDNQHSQTAGENGPTLLQDSHLLEKTAAFDRERIPERVVHARGAGAFGEFESTADLSELTQAAPFQGVGVKTPMFVRFSTVINSKGSPETVRDPRGFAARFYTPQGNWDLVGNNLPVFFIRDAMKFPDLIHSLKPSPITNTQDPNRYFDFLSFIPESTHMLTFLYSDLGTPASYREMDGFGVHAFKLVNKEGKVKYAKFNWRSNQGVRVLNGQQAKLLGGQDFNSHTRDLYKAIGDGQFPTWDLYIQVIDPADLDAFDFNPLDATKIWPYNLVKEQKVGRLTLNKIPPNFFNYTERFAPAPSNLIPGIEASEDKMLQGRLFSYADTQRYRLGINHQHFPVNQPRVPVANGNQDGHGNFRESANDINYEPSRKAGAYKDVPAYKKVETPLVGKIQQQPIHKTQNFKQAGALYRSMTRQQQANLVTNLAEDLNQVKDPEIKATIVSFLYKADAEYGTKVAKAIKLDPKLAKDRAAQLKD